MADRSTFLVATVTVRSLQAAAHAGSLRSMEILLAYGADASADNSFALKDAADDKNKTRLLLQHGANPDDHDRHGWPPFKRAVNWARLENIREMAKWKEEVEDIKEKDIAEDRRDKYNLIIEAIRQGRQDRQKYLGKRERER